jgi:intracellular sulfur oxidation DsrE/DsrF family protein
MKRFKYAVVAVAALALGFMVATPGHAAEKAKKVKLTTHHIAYQIDQNDPALMNLVLNNVQQSMEYYHSKGEQAQIEVVAYGPGLMMLRQDKSPVKDRLKRIKEGSFPSGVTYSACHNTMIKMEKKEGHAIPIISEARVVPGGVVRLTELEEQGWTYIRP